MNHLASLVKTKLRLKIMLSIALVVIITLISVNWYVISQVNRLAMAEGIKLARAMGNEYGNEMRRQLDMALETANTLAESFAAIKSVDESPNRMMLTRMIREVVDKTPAYFGAWTIWEPNALDGKDAQFIKAEGHDETGRFIPYWSRGGGFHLEPCMDYVQGAYYQTPLKTNRDYITDPTVYTIAGQKIMVVSVASPIRHQGAVVGVSGVDMSMQWFAELVNRLKPFETGRAFLVSNAGTYVSHPQADRVGKNIEAFLTGTDKTQVREAIANGRTYVQTLKGVKDQPDSIVVYNPMKIGQTGAAWSLAISVPIDKILAGNRKVAGMALLASLLAIALIVALIYFIVSSMIIEPVNSVVAGLQDIAEGEGDLTKRLTIQSGDEIGALAHWFNRFMEDLEEVIRKVKTSAANTEVSSKEVSAGAEGLSQSSQQQASAVEEVAATIEQMTSAIKQTADNADAGRRKGEETEESIKKGDEVAQQLFNAMSEISLSSKKIGEITATVNEVAFQTNLLALNAAVEAARAGEQGKGFAVVAEEVRALAQRSADAASQIRVLIEDTVQKVKIGDEMVKKTATSFTQISQLIDTLTTTMDDIATASAEQASGIDELNRAVTQIDSSTQMNASTVEELSSAASNLSMEASELAAAVERFQVSLDQPAHTGGNRIPR